MAKIIRSITSVLFGSYPQGTDGAVQPIEWQVRKQEGNKALLCSKNILTERRYDCKSNVWKNSEIRHWLNNECMNNAFTDDEKATILETKLPDVGTTDKVFLLSHEEAKKLFKGNRARRVKFGTCDYRWWWLRSPGLNDYDAAFVDGDDGLVYERGHDVEEEYGVRPALWVNLDSDIFNS